MRLRTAISLVAAMILSGAAVLAHAAGTVPANTEIRVSLDQSVSSKDAKVGQKVPGSVAQAVVVDGKTLIPKGAKCNLSVAEALPAGHLKGQAKLGLRLESVVVNGKTVSVGSMWRQVGPTHTKRNVVAIGGGTAAGALIGGLAGGGKGAAIGAGAGAAVGTAGAAATGKKDVNLPAETTLRFTTKSAVTIP